MVRPALSVRSAATATVPADKEQVLHRLGDSVANRVWGPWACGADAMPVLCPDLHTSGQCRPGAAVQQQQQQQQQQEARDKDSVRTEHHLWASEPCSWLPAFLGRRALIPARQHAQRVQGLGSHARHTCP